MTTTPGDESLGITIGWWYHFFPIPIRLKPTSMNFSRLNTGILLLLFTLPGAGGNDLDAWRGSKGEFTANPSSPIDEGYEAPYSDDKQHSQARSLDSFKGDSDAANGLQLAYASPSERFQDECGQCHGDAAEFVRESIIVRNGTLTGRASQIPVLEFLKTHQKLKQAEVNFYMDLLTRVAGEIGLQ